MYIIYSHNSNVSYIIGLGQDLTDMLSKKEEYLIVSMNSQPIPDLSGMWSHYSEAIVRAKKLKSTVAKAKMGLLDVTGNEDNSKNLQDSLIDEGTEFSLLSVHVNTIGVSMGLMLLMLILICIFRYLKIAHIKGCWSKIRCCRRKTILINTDGTMSYLNKSQRNSIVSGNLTLLQQPRDDAGSSISNEMKMEEIRHELRSIKQMQENEFNISSSSDIEYSDRKPTRSCPKVL